MTSVFWAYKVERTSPLTHSSLFVGPVGISHKVGTRAHYLHAPSLCRNSRYAIRVRILQVYN